MTGWSFPVLLPIWDSEGLHMCFIYIYSIHTHTYIYSVILRKEILSVVLIDMRRFREDR